MAQSNEHTVSCPTGTRAIGGGVGTTTAIPPTTSTSFPYSYRSMPVGAAGTPAGTADGDIPTGWLANASFQSSSSSSVFRYYAVCSAGSDATIRVAPFSVNALNTDPGGFNGAAVTCPTGQRALAGGLASDIAQSPNNFRILRSGPLDATSTGADPSGTDTGDVPTGWYGAERSSGVIGTTTFRTVAVCATDLSTAPPGDTPACQTARADLAAAELEQDRAEKTVHKLKKKVAKAKKAKGKRAKKKLKNLKKKLKSARRDLNDADDAAAEAESRVTQLC